MYSYWFEARGIQQYILETGKLKDMVGASRLVDELCQFSGSSDLLQKVLDAIPLAATKVRFLRRAGGAFILLLDKKEDAIALQNLWTLVVTHYAPGLEWIDALGDEKSTEPEAVKSCSDKLLSRRSNPPVSLPEASPFVRFSERTGRAGVKKDLDDWLDISTTRKRKMNNGTEEIGHHFLPVLPEEDKHVYAWAQSFDPKEDGSERLMPFLEGVQPSLGVIHADGNGLGVALQSLQAAAQKPDEYQYIYWEFSRAIATATRNAVQAATKDILIPKAVKNGSVYILPARPLVLGGDDITIIVRGDLALDYLNIFLQNFESESQKQLEFLHGGIPELPEKLTACGGVAFIKPTQPFLQAYALAESLCAHCKKQPTNEQNLKPSSLAFYRVTTSSIGRYDTILKEIETYLHNGTYHTKTMGAYDVVDTSGSNLPRFSDLKELHALFEVNGGPTKIFPSSYARKLLTEMSRAPQLVPQLYARWRQMIKKSDPSDLITFDGIMNRMGVGDPATSAFTNVIDAHSYTPLGDVVSLTSIMQKS